VHEDEIDIDGALVRRLLAAQFPQWASLPIRRVASAGTVNAIFRLGEDMSVRLPRTPRFQDWDVDCWLAALAGKLPIAIPEPVAAGEPDDGYPRRWSIHRWLRGGPWSEDRVSDPCAAAEQLAEFVHALQRLDPTAIACPPVWDGGRFADSDRAVRAMAPRAAGVDAKALLNAWDEALRVSQWDGQPVLVHWDLLPGNILVRDGAISAVIDWGALGAGDPSRDLLPTWTLFSGEARRVFRSAMSFGDDTWARARGWALAFVVGVAYYSQTNPGFAAECRATLTAALDDPS
jgi:aminoglycoside phosphotransferase (APT) family kinase protein